MRKRNLASDAESAHLNGVSAGESTRSGISVQRTPKCRGPSAVLPWGPVRLTFTPVTRLCHALPSHPGLRPILGQNVEINHHLAERHDNCRERHQGRGKLRPLGHVVDPRTAGLAVTVMVADRHHSRNIRRTKRIDMTTSSWLAWPPAFESRGGKRLHPDL